MLKLVKWRKMKKKLFLLGSAFTIRIYLDKQDIKWTMSPRGLTVSCKSPPHIRAYIDSGSPFGHALTHIPAFDHTWTQGINRCVLLLVGNYFTSLRHQMTSERQTFNWSGKCSSRPLIWGTRRYSSFDLKIWPWGTPFLTLVLTMKVISNRSSKLIS
jgi:hypothetical protein